MPKNKIRRALLSVSDKSGLVDFARGLERLGVEMISTGGTLKALREAGCRVRPVDDLTRFPEMFEGRVKTLHPKIHGGLLYRRDKASHRNQASRHRIEAIDLVVVNLYPFEQVTRRRGVSLEDAIENIDIGGPSMLRSAAKNHDAVTVVCDPSDYVPVLEEMEKGAGTTRPETRRHLAVKVFQRTAAYDGAIQDFLSRKMKTGRSSGGLPESIQIGYRRESELRYGENPHQRAALYVPSSSPAGDGIRQLHGKELSFNNFLDMEAAVDVIREFRDPAACVIKHSNPCGVAVHADLARALSDAVDSDPLSAFGGIVGLNRPCDAKTAQTVLRKLQFFEVVVAPRFSREAVSLLSARKNLRIIENTFKGKNLELDMRFLKNGLLVQDRDRPIAAGLSALKKKLRFVTRRKLTGKNLDALLFAWTAAKTVKSNAIVLTRGTRTVGVGAGQMSRVDSVYIACRKAGSRARGAMMGSDAFFPMPDAIETAARHGIRAIIQPGGSIRDKDVIAACDKAGIAMALTGMRHFKH